MRQEILKVFETLKDTTNLIVLTHNVDFIFIQMIVVSALKKCGHPKLTIFADANCANDSFASQSPLLNNLGIRYRVVPVEMPQGFHFHPKAVFLSGSQKAILMVGSGNLTFAGWSENAEAWVRFDTDSDGNGAFSAFFQFLQEIISKVPLKESIEAEIRESFDPRTHLWASNLGKPEQLIWKMGKGKALFERMTELLDDQPVSSLTICSPFFDQEAKALNVVLNKLGPAHTNILIQNGRSTLLRNAAAKLPQTVRVSPVEFKNSEKDGSKRRRIIHAKFYCIEQGQKVTIFIGSANCSNAALIIPGRSGNAELMVPRTLDGDGFAEQFLNEFENIEGEPQLKELEDEKDNSGTQQTNIRILAARFDHPRLFIAVSCPPDVTIHKITVDDKSQDFEIIESGVALARIDQQPRLVTISGIQRGNIINSQSMWIDNEKALRSSARGRTLAEVIRDRVQVGYWNYDSWTEIVEVFYKNIQYIQPQTHFTFGKIFGQKEDTKIFEYSHADVFSGSYRLPFMKLSPLPLGNHERIRSLQQMLLRWFGLGRLHETPEEVLPNSDDDDDIEDTVDHPEKLSQKSTAPILKEIPLSYQKRIGNILMLITERITGPGYIENRDPEIIGADIKILSVLLRVGLYEKWIDEDSFYDTTHQIWSKLFLSSEGQPSIGWLERRYRNAESKEDFVSRIKSADLSAAFAAWAMAVPRKIHTSFHLRFTLSCILSVARLPWLWLGGDYSLIASELEQTLIFVNQIHGNKQSDWETINYEWRKIIRRGLAIREFEKAMDGRAPVELKDRIIQEDIPKGELLWQGESGFCVATHFFKRSWPDYSAKVLMLQGQKGEVTWAYTKYIIPIRALLNNSDYLSNAVLGDELKSEIRSLLDEVVREFQ